MSEFKVRAVEFEEKSAVEIEEQLLKEHAEKTGQTEEVETVEKVEIAASEEKLQEIELDDSKVLSYIGNRYNREISSLDELLEQKNNNEELDPEVATYLKYKKETGRGIDDFIKLNKDYDKEDPDKLLFEYYKAQNKELDEDEVRFEMESQFKYDADFDEETDIKKKQLAKKKEVAKAKEYFNSLKEQYKVPLESREAFVPKEERDAYEAYKQYKDSQMAMSEEQAKKSQFFSEKTNELFSDKFEGFKFAIDENNVMTYKPGESPDLLKQQSDLSTFVSKFLNEDGYLKDAELFHRAIAVASNPEKFAKFFYEKGVADAVKDVSKETKNIDMRQSTQVTPKSGMQIRAIEPEMGSRLVIKKFKS